MPKNLVIVESPAKAKTIEKYLGPDFQVLASVGHIRKDTKVDKETFDVTYEIDADHKKIISTLKKAIKSAQKVWLATDEDREGESISWHLIEVLKLPHDTARITFHEITKPALETAIKSPRTINMAMVDSQKARQTLDMLVGYDLSDIVRKKVPGAISAGRVQSPALRLIVEKEQEIEDFEASSSFKITATFKKPHTDFEFSAILDDKTPLTEEQAESLLNKLTNNNFKVTDIKKSTTVKKNPIPLTTAALQIEASSKLGFSARTTMSAAQGLYQSGMITYHRTDSLNLSTTATSQIAQYIKTTFGTEYLKTRHFKTQSASAQEAHEAIRPTNISLTTAGKNQYEKKLYQLIWSRTVATQMANAKIAKTTFKITSNQTTFLAKGEIVLFDGFLKIYGNSKDIILPELSIGDSLIALNIVAHQTFQTPPARFTESSLVKKLEELGIGRPSTYASIMTALITRKYITKGISDGTNRQVTKLTLNLTKNPPHIPIKTQVYEKFGNNKGKLLPTPIGKLVSHFLIDHFQNIVDYQFTATIEKELDLIAEQKLQRVKMLKQFYQPFQRTVLTATNAERYNNARLLGHDPKTKKPIYAKIGKNGGFIQLGDNEKTSGEKPRFAPLPQNQTVETTTLSLALKQLALPTLPRILGTAPDGVELIATNGPFGPYLKGGKYSIPMKDLDPYTVSLATVLPLYQQKLDSIIADWGDIMIINGTYGPYIKGPGRKNHLKIPKDENPHKITKDEATKRLAHKPKKTTSQRQLKRHKNISS